MKVLHLIYSRQVAGAEKYLKDLLPGLNGKGMDCRLICVVPEADKYKFIEFCSSLNESGVETVLITGSQIKFLSTAKKINKYLLENNITYLHAHLFNSDILAVLTKKMYNRKIKLLSTKHGYQEKYFHNYAEKNGKIDYNFYYFISKYINRNIDYQFTVSKAMSELYYKLKLTTDKIPYIHHGVDLQHPGISQAFKLSANQLIIVGRIEKIKGHGYLLKAMPAVIKRFPDVKLLVLGNGTEIENLKMQAESLGISGHLNFMGFQPDPSKYIAASDIMISASFYESFGLIYIEAMALKTPVIAFDVPACNEILKNGETGILVPLYDSGTLAEKIIHLLLNPEERKRIADNAHTEYISGFTKSRMVAETVAWYKSINIGEQQQKNTD